MHNGAMLRRYPLPALAVIPLIGSLVAQQGAVADALLAIGHHDRRSAAAACREILAAGELALPALYAEWDRRHGKSSFPDQRGKPRDYRVFDPAMLWLAPERVLRHREDEFFGPDEFGVVPDPGALPAEGPLETVAVLMAAIAPRAPGVVERLIDGLEDRSDSVVRVCGQLLVHHGPHDPKELVRRALAGAWPTASLLVAMGPDGLDALRRTRSQRTSWALTLAPEIDEKDQDRLLRALRGSRENARLISDYLTRVGLAAHDAVLGALSNPEAADVALCALNLRPAPDPFPWAQVLKLADDADGRLRELALVTLIQAARDPSVPVGDGEVASLDEVLARRMAAGSLVAWAGAMVLNRPVGAEWGQAIKPDWMNGGRHAIHWAGIVAQTLDQGPPGSVWGDAVEVAAAIDAAADAIVERVDEAGPRTPGSGRDPWAGLGPRGAAVLMDALGSSDPVERRAACRALGRVVDGARGAALVLEWRAVRGPNRDGYGGRGGRSRNAVDLDRMVAALGSEDVSKRRQAVRVLTGELERLGERQREALARCGFDDADLSVRLAFLQALLRQTEKMPSEWSSRLFRATADSDWGVRLGAVCVAANLLHGGDEAAWPVVRERLCDVEPSVRAAALGAGNSLAVPAGREPFWIEALGDPQATVVRTASERLKRRVVSVSVGEWDALPAVRAMGDVVLGERPHELRMQVLGNLAACLRRRPSLGSSLFHDPRAAIQSILDREPLSLEDREAVRAVALNVIEAPVGWLVESLEEDLRTGLDLWRVPAVLGW